MCFACEGEICATDNVLQLLVVFLGQKPTGLTYFLSLCAYLKFTGLVFQPDLPFRKQFVIVCDSDEFDLGILPRSFFKVVHLT